MMSCCCWFKQGPSPRVNTCSLSCHMRWRNLCLLCTWVFISGSHLTLRRQCLFPAEASNTVLAPNVSLQRLVRVPTHNHTLDTCIFCMTRLEFHLQASFIRIISVCFCTTKNLWLIPPSHYVGCRLCLCTQASHGLFVQARASKQVCTTFYTQWSQSFKQASVQCAVYTVQLCNVVSIF